MLRSVWWRSSAARLPRGEELEPLVEPRRRDPRPGHRPHPRRRELDRQRDPVEAPAQLAPPRPRCCVGRARSRARRRGPVDEQPHRLGPASTSSAPASAVGPAQRRHRARSAPRRPRGPPGSSPAPTLAGTRWAIASTSSATASRRCSQLSSTSSSRFVPRYSSTDSSRLRPGDGCTPKTRRQRRPTRASGIASPARARTATHRRGTRATTSAATCSASRVLPTPPTPVSVTSDGRGPSSANARELARRGRRTTSPGAAGSPAARRATASGGNSRRRPGCVHLEHPLRAGARSRSRCSPRSTSSDVRRQRVACQTRRVASETTTWPPCATRHQPRGPVHRRFRT